MGTSEYEHQFFFVRPDHNGDGNTYGFAQCSCRLLTNTRSSVLGGSMDKSRKQRLNRRGFLKGAAVGAAAFVTEVPETKAQGVQTARAAAPSPSARALAAETE